jgi:hypothetical protein
VIEKLVNLNPKHSVDFHSFIYYQLINQYQ